MSEIIIFLDMDGVIADFESHAHAMNKFNADGSLNRDALDYAWWSTIPIFDGAQEFYAELKALSTVKFLTGPMIMSDSHHGKADWIINFSPEGKWGLKDLIICPASNKHYLASPTRLLIDDMPKNIKAWEAAGGVAILHTGDFAKTLEQVKRFMQQQNAPIPENKNTANTPRK